MLHAYQANPFIHMWSILCVKDKLTVRDYRLDKGTNGRDDSNSRVLVNHSLIPGCKRKKEDQREEEIDKKEEIIKIIRDLTDIRL